MEQGSADGAREWRWLLNGQGTLMFPTLGVEWHDCWAGVVGPLVHVLGLWLALVFGLCCWATRSLSAWAEQNGEEVG